MYPSDLRYTRDHEWVRVSGTEAVVGITDYAQQQLGDVVFVELPAVGRALTQGEAFGTIESVKAVSELFSPLSGEVVEVNESLQAKPEAVNSDPHTTWMIKLKVARPDEASALLSSAQYDALVGSA